MVVRRDTSSGLTEPPRTSQAQTTAYAGTSEEQFAAHVRSGRRGLRWHYELGVLALACCPARVRNRTARVRALADDNPPCSTSLLFKVMKFAGQHPRAEMARLERAGLGWDQQAILLSVPRGERRAAVAEVIRLGLTSRQVRLWKEEHYGNRPPRGGRGTTPLLVSSPCAQARALTRDCRKMCVRHGNTAGVFEQVRQAIEVGTVPTPEELTVFWAAADATRSLLQEFGQVMTLLERVTAP